jgi:pyridoxal phosphate enzyme (YggS family)
MSTLADRIAAVQARIAAAIERRGAGPVVTLCAVSKRQPADAIRAAAELGLRDFGENYAQELKTKREQLADVPDVRWHAIGPVQTNKIKLVVGTALVHTIDRAELVHRIDARAASLGLVQDTLVQVNVAEEAGKSGVAPGGVEALLDAFAGCTHVRCRGLMLIPPEGEPEATRRWFRALADLRDRLATTSRPGVDLAELSMGMSGDYEVAIEEGATIVRVGTAIFGPRPA